MRDLTVYTNGERYSDDEFTGVVNFGPVCADSDIMARWLFETLRKIPAKYVDLIADNCCFLVPESAPNAGMIPKELTVEKQIILVSSELFLEDRDKIVYMIAHECAHFVLGHKSQMFYDLTSEEDLQQELEADALACAWAEVKTEKKIERLEGNGFNYSFPLTKE